MPGTESTPSRATGPARRTVLAVAAAGTGAVLAGCAAYGDEQSAPAPAATGAPAAGPGGASSGAGAPGAGAPGAGAPTGLVAVADVPVGGGTVLADQKLVRTRPTAGTVLAFTAVCTHAGCTVGDVSGGTINCPCHGSKFKIEDGSVAGGPAPKPLPPVAVSVQGGQVVRG